MAYEQERAKGRLLVDTPTSRREVVEHQAVRRPESSGTTGAMLAVIIIGAIALATVIILFAMNQQQDTSNVNTASQPPQTIVQQPAQQPPVIINEPAPAAQPAPVIINPGAPGGSTLGNPSADANIQAAIDKKLSDDPVLSTLGVTATFMDGKATLIGTVKNQAQKGQVERAVRSVKGVKAVDNQIIVSAV